MIGGHEGRVEDDNGPPNMYVDTSHRSHYYYVILITIYCLRLADLMMTWENISLNGSWVLPA